MAPAIDEPTAAVRYETAASAKRREREARARLAAAAPAWLRRAVEATPPLTWRLLLLVLLAAKVTALVLYGPALWRAARCSLRDVDAPLWDVHYDDWTEERLFTPADEAALDAFLARHAEPRAQTFGELDARRREPRPLLLAATTRDSVALAHHWACRARAAAQRPVVAAVDRDGANAAETCAALYAVAPWLPCLALPAHAALDARHAFLVARARLAWRVLKRGHDLVLSDTDVVFAPNATLRLGEHVPRGADLVALARGPEGVGERAAARLGFARPNFGLVYARACAATVAFFQLVHLRQATARSEAEQTHLHCMIAPWRRLRVAHWPASRFLDGAAWRRWRRHGAAAAYGANATSASLSFLFEPYWRRRAAATAPAQAGVQLPVAVHLSSSLHVDDAGEAARLARRPGESVHAHVQRTKVAELGAWGLWSSECGGNATALDYWTARHRADAPRLFSTG